MRLPTMCQIVPLLLLAATSAHGEPPCEKKDCPSGWLSVDSAQREHIFALAEDYKSFMAVARTQFATVAESERRARAAGFKPWKAGEALTPGSRWFVNNRDQSLALFVIGTEPLADGVRLVAAHIDSPHLELKARPLYEAEGFAMLQTTFHGGIINYQWGNTPLALIGRLNRKDGSTVNLSVGLAPNDPVFMIAGLSPHVDAELRERKNREVLQAEELDPIAGSMPKSATDGVRTQVMEYLRATYGIGLDDFVSASLSLVPAAAPRDVGFDRAMMAMYGQDDRLGVYAAVKSLTEAKNVRQTAVLLLANNEEEGNVNNTGATSEFITDLMGELLYAKLGASYKEPLLKRMLGQTHVLSVDMNDAINPIWPSAWEPTNAPRIGQGVNIKIYGHGNNATPAYAAWLRRVFDDSGVRWQTATYKVGKASGGTLGGELSRHNMDVIDIGAPVLSIHNVYDLSSKIDVWWLCRGVAAFYSADP